MSGKQCDKCGQPFKGFGTTCSVCRKGGKAGGLQVKCDKCGVFFTGFGSVCQECLSGRGIGRTGVRAPTPEEVDGCLDRIDQCIQKVDVSQESMVRLRKAEFDLLGQLEIARDLIQRILKSGDRMLLKSTFVDCGRVARLDAFLSSINLSDMNAADQRFKNCISVVDSVKEMVENDLGLQEEFFDAQETAQTGLLMKRLSFLMDEEKVAEVHTQIDQMPTGQQDIKGNYASAYAEQTGGYSNFSGYYGGGYYAGYGGNGGGYGHGHGDGRGVADDVQWDEVEDFSDWDDEDAEEMTEDQADALFKTNARVLFDELDTNKDGALSKEEVLNGATGLFGLLKACRIHKRKHVIKMFKEGDIDQNGTLDFDEFMTYIQRARQKSLAAQPKQIDDGKVKKVFDLMDRDGDGTITREELKLAYAGVLLMAGESVDSKRISKWAGRNFKKYDTDGSATLDLKEFKQLLQHSGALAPMLDFVDGM